MDKFHCISVNFESEKMVDHILEIPRLEDGGVKCLNFNNLGNDPVRNKDNIYISRYLIPMFIETLCRI